MVKLGDAVRFSPMRPVVELPVPMGTNVIEQRAKDFYWQTGSDSLKEFVEWVQR